MVHVQSPETNCRRGKRKKITGLFISSSATKYMTLDIAIVWLRYIQNGSYLVKDSVSRHLHGGVRRKVWAMYKLNDARLCHRVDLMVSPEQIRLTGLMTVDGRLCCHSCRMPLKLVAQRQPEKFLEERTGCIAKPHHQLFAASSSCTNQSINRCKFVQ